MVVGNAEVGSRKKEGFQVLAFSQKEEHQEILPLDFHPPILTPERRTHRIAFGPRRLKLQALLPQQQQQISVDLLQSGNKTYQ